MLWMTVLFDTLSFTLLYTLFQDLPTTTVEATSTLTNLKPCPNASNTMSGMSASKSNDAMRYSGTSIGHNLNAADQVNITF